MATNANKKPGPAQPPAAAKAKPQDHPKPAPAAEADNDLDDETAGGDETPVHKLPPAKKMAARIGNVVNRMEVYAGNVKNWPGDDLVNVRGSLDAAISGLKSAAEILAKLPDDYKPRVAKAGKQTGGKLELLPGSMIRITDKRMPEYEGVLEAEQMRGIKVVEVRGNKVIALTKDGVKAMLARGHVCPDV